MIDERPTDAEAVPADSPELEAEPVADVPMTMETLEARCQELVEAHVRAVADYRNLERRTQEGRAELRRLTTAAVVINLLPIYDDLTLALQAVDDDITERDWVLGISLIRDKFQGVIAATGAHELESLGKPFDPRFHEAVGYAAGPDGQVVHVMRSGWAIDDHVVRPSMVMVGSGDVAPTGSTNDDSDAGSNAGRGDPTS
jgi:molecular chaperone GrpE